MNIRIDLNSDSKDILFRIWIFGEDLSLKFRDSALADLPMDEVDTATTTFRVRLKSKQKMRRAAAIIEEVLRKHKLFELATLTVET